MKQQPGASSAAVRGAALNLRSKGRQNYRESDVTSHDPSQDESELSQQPAKAKPGEKKSRQPLKPRDRNVQASQAQDGVIKPGLSSKVPDVDHAHNAIDRKEKFVSDKPTAAGRRGKTTAAAGKGGCKRKTATSDLEEVVDLTQGDKGTQQEAATQGAPRSLSQPAASAKRRKGPNTEVKDARDQRQAASQPELAQDKNETANTATAGTVGSQSQRDAASTHGKGPATDDAPQQEEPERPMASQKTRPARKSNAKQVAAGVSEPDAAVEPLQGGTKATATTEDPLQATSKSKPAAGGASHPTTKVRFTANGASQHAAEIKSTAVPGASSAPASADTEDAMRASAPGGSQPKPRKARSAAILAELQPQESKSVAELQKQYDELQKQYDELKKVQLSDLQDWMEEMNAAHQEKLSSVEKMVDFWKKDADAQRNLNAKYRSDKLKADALEKDKRSLEQQVVQLQLDAKKQKEEWWREKQQLQLDANKQKEEWTRERVQLTQKVAALEKELALRIQQTINSDSRPSTHAGLSQPTGKPSVNADLAQPASKPAERGGLSQLLDYGQSQCTGSRGDGSDHDQRVQELGKQLEQSHERVQELMKQLERSKEKMEELEKLLEAQQAPQLSRRNSQACQDVMTPGPGSQSQSARDGMDSEERGQSVERIRDRLQELRRSMRREENEKLRMEYASMKKAKPKMRNFFCQANFDVPKELRDVEVQCNIMQRQFPAPTVGVLHPTPIPALTPRPSPPLVFLSPRAKLTYSSALEEDGAQALHGPIPAHLLGNQALVGEEKTNGFLHPIDVDQQMDTDVQNPPVRTTAPALGVTTAAGEQDERQMILVGFEDRMELETEREGAANSMGSGDRLGADQQSGKVTHTSSSGDKAHGQPGEKEERCADLAGKTGPKHQQGWRDPSWSGSGNRTQASQSGEREHVSGNSGGKMNDNTQCKGETHSSRSGNRMEALQQPEGELNFLGMKDRMATGTEEEREVDGSAGTKNMLGMDQTSERGAVPVQHELPGEGERVASAQVSPARVGSKSLSLAGQEPEANDPTDPAQGMQIMALQHHGGFELATVPTLRRSYRIAQLKRGTVMIEEVASGFKVVLRPFFHISSPVQVMQVFRVEQGKLASPPELDIEVGMMLVWQGDQAFVEWLDSMLHVIPLVGEPAEDAEPQI